MARSVMITSVYVVLMTVLASGIAYAQAGDPVAGAQWKTTELEKGYVVFEHSTLENLPPTHVPVPEAIVDTVSCALARGEYESVQIGVHALAGGLTNIRITVVSDLEVTVYHRIDPGLKQQLASDPDSKMPGWMSSAVYLQRGEVVGELDERFAGVIQIIRIHIVFKGDQHSAVWPIHNSRPAADLFEDHPVFIGVNAQDGKRPGRLQFGQRVFFAVAGVGQPFKMDPFKRFGGAGRSRPGLERGAIAYQNPKVFIYFAYPTCRRGVGHAMSVSKSTVPIFRS